MEETGLEEVTNHLNDLQLKAVHVVDDQLRPMTEWPAAKVALWYRKRLEERFGVKRARHA